MSAPFPLDAEVVRGFVEAFLIERFDERAQIARVHDAWWQLVCSNHPRVVIAAPRKHGKTTALNHAYGLAASLSKAHPFQIKLCKTYDLACERIEAARMELTDNAKLRSVFKLKTLLRDRENDLIAEMDDGYRFRMYAMGMDQSKRGILWGTVRPTLINGDDLEDEKEVMNPDKRDADKKWLMNTLLPMGADRAQYRIYGTILHLDSLLAWLLTQKGWKAARFEACDEQVSEASLLWRSKFSVEKLKEIKQLSIDAGDVAGFNMEYRNIAVSEEDSFFRSSDFLPMTEEDHRRTKLFYVGGDLAYSKKEHRDYTVFVVGGIDEDGVLHIVDERRGRWDGKEVIDEMYRIEEAWHPEEWFIEGGAIKDTLGAALEMRMREEGFLNLRPGLIPTKDKATRASPIQARMRSRAVRWDTEATWFPDHKQELMEFTQQGTRGAHDDRCLIGETPVLMADGTQRSLESVVVGDQVLTPNGPRRVIMAGMTNQAAVVYEGCGLIGTADHPVWSCFRNDWCRLASLDQWDILCHATVSIGTPWQESTEKRPRVLNDLFLTELFIDAIQSRSTNTFAVISRALVGAVSIIGTYWKSIMARFQEAVTSIMSMATNSITPSQISVALPKSSTMNCIARNDQFSGDQRDRLSTWQKFVTRLLCGIGANKEGNGTSNTENKVGSEERNAGTYAGNATSTFGHLRKARNFVLSDARTRIGISGIQVTELPKKLDEKRPVYNLTVDGGRYFANGVLVHNCDADAWLGQGLKLMAIPQTKDEQDEEEYQDAKRQSRYGREDEECITGYPGSG